MNSLNLNSESIIQKLKKNIVNLHDSLGNGEKVISRNCMKMKGKLYYLIALWTTIKYKEKVNKIIY